MAHIEVIVMVVSFLLFIIWLIWLKLSKKYHNWRYNSKNDRGRIGEEHRQELIKSGKSDPSTGITRAITSNAKGIDDPKGQGELEGRELLSSTTSDARGEESNSSRRSSESSKEFIRNPFRKRNWRTIN